MQLGIAHSKYGDANLNILRTCTGMTVFVSHHTSSLRPLTYISDKRAALIAAKIRYIIIIKQANIYSAIKYFAYRVIFISSNNSICYLGLKKYFFLVHVMRFYTVVY